MAAGTYNFSIEQGCDFSKTFTWKNAAGVAIDIAGYVFRMMARNDYGDAAPVLNLSTTGEISEAEIEAAGLGYTALDVLTVAGGTSGTVRVDSVSVLGAVTAITILTVGSAYESEVKATTGGTGAGCTLDITALTGITIGTPASAGQFTVAMSAAITAALDFSDLKYDLEAMGPTPTFTVTRLLEGTITLSKEVTK